MNAPLSPIIPGSDEALLIVKNSILSEGRWIIGLGTNIPLNHFAWFPCQPQLLNQHNLSEGTVADLIDHTNHSWNPGFVKPLYPYPLVKKS